MIAQPEANPKLGIIINASQATPLCSPLNKPPKTTTSPPEMTANAFHNIAQIEASLWEAADQLRANSKLTAIEQSMPVLGVIFCATPANACLIVLFPSRN